MLAAVIEGPGAVVVRDTAPPRAAGLALVRVTQAGICGTDRALAAGGIAVRPPRVLGHEMTGRVEVPAAGGAVPAGHSGRGEPGGVLRRVPGVPPGPAEPVRPRRAARP